MAPGCSVGDRSFRQHLLIGQLITGRATDTVLLCGDTEGLLLHPFSRNTSPLTPVEPPDAGARCWETPGRGQRLGSPRDCETPTAQVAGVPSEHRGGREGGSLELSGERRPWLSESAGASLEPMCSEAAVKRLTGDEGTEPLLPPS